MANYAQWAINLPNQFQPPGAVMEQGLAMQQKQNTQLADLYQQKIKEQKANAATNLDYLNKQTQDIEKDQTGDEVINARTHDEINKVFQEFSQYAKQMSPEQYQPALAQRLLELSKWHQGALTAYQNLVTGMQDNLKDYPNLDARQVRNIGMNKIASSFINPDGSLVKSELIHNVNPLQDLQDKDVRALATSDTSPFYDYFKKFDKTPVGDKEYVSKKGFATKYNWKGSMLGDLTQVEKDGDNKPTGIALKYDTVPGMTDENGKPLRLMSDQLMTQLENAKGGVGNSMDKLWMDNKQNIMHQWSVRNRKLPDANEEEYLKRNFLYKEAQNVIPSAIQTEESNVTPRDRVSNNFFFGSQQPFNQQTSGTEFDRIGDVETLHFPHGKIQNGAVSDNNGNPYSGEITTGKKDIPASLLNVLKTAGYDPYKLPQFFDLKVDKGRIEAIRPSGGAWIDRQAMFNFQLKNNTESPKTVQPIYGNTPQENKPVQQQQTTQQSTQKKKIANF